MNNKLKLQQKNIVMRVKPFTEKNKKKKIGICSDPDPVPDPDPDPLSWKRIRGSGSASF